MNKVYVALHTVPDYSAGHGAFKGVATTLDGAIKLLYPNGDVEFQESFSSDGVWIGPDGFGEVRRVEVHD